MLGNYKINWKPGKRIVVIPDLQVRQGVPTKHIIWAARCVAEYGPDHVVQIGDWFDMPSLSSYTSRARKAFDRKSYRKDIDAGNAALDMFDEELARLGAAPAEYHITLGNHENRINRAIEADPDLADYHSTDDMQFAEHGWHVHEFLAPLDLCGIRFQHFFPQNTRGRVMQTTRGSASAGAQMNAIQQSCISGHQQGLDMHIRPGLEGGAKWSIIAGSFYLHNEAYLSPCGNNDWRGIIVCNDVRNGTFDPMPLSMDYLARKYGR